MFLGPCYYTILVDFFLGFFLFSVLTPVGFIRLCIKTVFSCFALVNVGQNTLF